MEFDIFERGLHDFLLSSGKRDGVRMGDMLGVFTRLKNERAVIGFDTVFCVTPTLLLSRASKVTTSLTLWETRKCHNYSINAIFIGKYK